MGLLKCKYNGVELPVNITKLTRNLTPVISNTTNKIGNTNGVQLVSSSYGENTITIEYRIENGMAKDLSEFRRKMAGIVYKKETCQLIFSDEPYLYYNAILSSQALIDENFIHSTGSIIFLVPDGTAHETVEKQFVASENEDGILEATIINNGTESVPIDYEITHNHENGYIGIVSEEGVIELGCIDEVDTEVRQKSAVLLDYKKYADYAAMTDGQGIVTEAMNFNGTFKQFVNNGTEWLALGNVGSGSRWHGAAKQITFPADENGVVGASNFLAQMKVWFETWRVKQTGLIEMVLGDGGGKHLASIHFVKSTYTSNSASCVFQIQLKEKGRIRYEPTYKSPTGGTGMKQNGAIVYIRKTGELFEFYFNGKTYSYRVPALKDVKAKTLTLFLGQFGTRNDLVSSMYIRDTLFQKNNVDYIYDIPNRYRKDSVVFVDGSAGKVYTDGVPTLEDEVLGSTYFKAPPGETKVQFYCSEFSEPAPSIVARIREAYL